MYPILYKASLWDDEICVEHGIIMAPSYADGMTQIEKYYGNDLCAIEMFMCEEGPLMITEEFYNEIKNKVY